MGTDATSEAEFILFRDIGQRVVGKPVGAVLRSNQGTENIPPAIAQIVSKKFTWHCNITERSFHGPNKTYQVNRIITALGRQTSMPRLSDSISASTPPSPHQLSITGPEAKSAKIPPLVFSTQKRLFQQSTSAHDVEHLQAEDPHHTDESPSLQPPEKNPE